jgi:hypothetical protein
MTERLITQRAPWPHFLEHMVEDLNHRPNWTAVLHEDLDRGQGSRGTTLEVHIVEPDAYHPEKLRSVVHWFPVPPAAYDARSWRRWLFDRLRDIDTHEAMEHFTIAGEKPYAPSHGPGNDPYMVREVGTDLDRRTSFRGEVNQPPANVYDPSDTGTGALDGGKPQNVTLSGREYERYLDGALNDPVVPSSPAAPAECSDCGRKRDERGRDNLAYNPMQVVLNQEIGWYSGDDGEFCGQCMATLIRRANS